MRTENQIFKFAVADALEMVELNPTQVISFEDFRSGRDFTSVEAVDQGFSMVLEASKITGHCVVYPGDQFLGYRPETGEAWFEDYAGTIRGPIEQVEQRLYLWALVEDTYKMMLKSD